MADIVVETVDPAASVVCDECAGSSWTDDSLNFLFSCIPAENLRRTLEEIGISSRLIVLTQTMSLRKGFLSLFRKGMLPIAVTGNQQDKETKLVNEVHVTSGSAVTNAVDSMTMSCLFWLLCRSKVHRFLARCDATLSPALLVVRWVASSLFLEGWRRFVSRFVDYSVN